jgi:hypothetical protein
VPTPLALSPFAITASLHASGAPGATPPMPPGVTVHAPAANAPALAPLPSPWLLPPAAPSGSRSPHATRSPRNHDARRRLLFTSRDPHWPFVAHQWGSPAGLGFLGSIASLALGRYRGIVYSQRLVSALVPPAPALSAPPVPVATAGPSASAPIPTDIVPVAPVTNQHSMVMRGKRGFHQPICSRLPNYHRFPRAIVLPTLIRIGEPLWSQNTQRSCPTTPRSHSSTTSVQCGDRQMGVQTQIRSRWFS